MNYAYFYYVDSVTMLSEFVVSCQSLKKTKPKYPIYCMISDAINRDFRILNFLWATLGVGSATNEQPLSEFIYDENGVKSVFCCSGKLKVFDYTEFDKIVLIDTDTYITQNIDELFNYPSGSMGSHLIEPSPNAGVLVVEPSKDVYHTFLKKKDEGYQKGYFDYMFDQNFVCEYFDYYNHPELHLPYIYNTIVPHISIANIDVTKSKILHFGCIGYKCEDAEEEGLRKVAHNDVEWQLIEDYMREYTKVINYYRTLRADVPLALPKYSIL